MLHLISWCQFVLKQNFIWKEQVSESSISTVMNSAIMYSVLYFGFLFLAMQGEVTLWVSGWLIYGTWLRLSACVFCKENHCRLRDTSLTHPWLWQKLKVGEGTGALMGTQALEKKKTASGPETAETKIT